MYLFLEKVPPHATQLLTVEGFIKKYLEFQEEKITHRKAYEKTEKVFNDLFGKRKYKNFESFRQVRDRYLKEANKK